MSRIEKRTLLNIKSAAWFTGFISFVVFVSIIAILKNILIPFTLALFLTFLFYPVLTFLKKFKISKIAGVLLILFCFIAIAYFIGLILVSESETFIIQLTSYSEKVETSITIMLRKIGLSYNDFTDFTGLKPGDLKDDNLPRTIFSSGIFTGAISSFSSVISDMLVALIFWIFMIIGKEKFEKKINLAYDDSDGKIKNSMQSINNQLQSYLFIKTIISLLVSIFTIILMLIYDIDFPVIWGILTFLLNFIPNIGPFAATISPILVAVIEYGLGWNSISFSIILTIIHNLFGNFLEPHFLGRHMDLSPVFVLFSLIFWGWIWGIAGMFMAVPIAAAMKIIFSNIEPLKPIALLLGTKTV